MKALVERYKTAPSIYELSRILVRDIPQKNYLAECIAIYNYVRDYIRYVRDTLNIETVQTPVQTLKIATGDCDDKAVLLCSLLQSIGHRTRFLVVGSNGRFYHVLVQVFVNNRWFNADPCEPLPFGQVKMLLPEHATYE